MVAHDKWTLCGPFVDAVLLIGQSLENLRTPPTWALMDQERGLLAAAAMFHRLTIQCFVMRATAESPAEVGVCRDLVRALCEEMPRVIEKLPGGISPESREVISSVIQHCRLLAQRPS